MSSCEAINKFYPNTRLVFPPNRMATDLRLPEEAAYAAANAYGNSRDIPPEEMDAYCQRVQQQLEEDSKRGIKREIIY